MVFDAKNRFEASWKILGERNTDKSISTKLNGGAVPFHSTKKSFQQSNVMIHIYFFGDFLAAAFLAGAFFAAAFFAGAFFAGAFFGAGFLDAAFLVACSICSSMIC